MFDRPIEVLRYRDSRDEYGDRSKELVPVASLVAQRTESGGRENLYAGRIVHENEVAYTIRYRHQLLRLFCRDLPFRHRSRDVSAR